MKLFDKVKNLFVEEIEEENPVKKEIIKVEIPSPEEEEKIIVKEKVEEKVTMAEVLDPIKKEEKFNSVVFFDDEDFDTLTKPKELRNKTVLKREGYHSKEVKEEKKVFKPTPIISPIYGILDKNYHKEDIAPKKITTSLYYDIEDVSIDDVRNKAYGTLEDELETTLFSKSSIIINEEEVIEEMEEETDMFEELEKEVDNLNTDSEETENYDTFEMDLLSELQSEPEETNFIEEEMDKDDENIDLSETDLFNLIDSMYEKREGE